MIIFHQSSESYIGCRYHLASNIRSCCLCIRPYTIWVPHTLRIFCMNYPTPGPPGRQLQQICFSEKEQRLGTGIAVSLAAPRTSGMTYHRHSVNRTIWTVLRSNWRLFYSIVLRGALWAWSNHGKARYKWLFSFSFSFSVMRNAIATNLVSFWPWDLCKSACPN